MTTATATKTIERRVTLSRTEQDCYYLTIELPEGVTAEQVDAELVAWRGKYATHSDLYSWGEKGPMDCGAIVTTINESCDDCPELDCAPIVRDEATGDLVPGSDEWLGPFRPWQHVEIVGLDRELVRQALLNGTPEQQALAKKFEHDGLLPANG